MAELHDWNSDEFLGFNLKLLGKKSKKNVLVSAGKLSDKERMFPALQKLAKLNVELFATPGTYRFLKQKGIENQEIHKIADRREPNIRTFLDENRLDLIINVLTGDNDYDEVSDSKLIRSLAIEQGIPLITDVDVAIESIDQLVKRDVEGFYRYKSGDPRRPWDMRAEFLRLVHENGGFASYHAHYDKAYLISPDNLRLSMVDMQKKWALYDHLKESYTRETLIERISRGVQTMVDQGAAYCRTLIDADSTIRTLGVEAALEVKKKFKGQIAFEIGVQPLQGVLDDESREQFEKACSMADVVGGLPSKDRLDRQRLLRLVLQEIADDRAGRRVVPGPDRLVGGHVPVPPPADDGRGAEHVPGLLFDRVRPLADRRQVVEDPDGPALGADHEVVVLDDEVGDGHGRHVEPERLPGVPAVVRVPHLPLGPQI